MLQELRIKNFVLIEDLIINFRKGLNILTGETGAGKSILIGALSGILGEKMTTDMIRSGFEKATLEGEFDISNLSVLQSLLEDSGIEHDDNTIILRRELFSSGKGRCFVNAIQIPISKLKTISEHLVDIHGQNEHQSIIKVSKHRELLDSFAGHDALVDSIKELHHNLSEIKESLDSFKIDEREKARRIEYNTFAINEIESVNLVSGEEEELKNESVLLANAEKLFKEIHLSTELLHGDKGILQQLKIAEQSLSKISEYDMEISGLLDSLNESLYSLEDVGLALRNYDENIDYSPERINQVEERISLISSLKKKYGASIEEILEFAEKSKRELEAINTSDEELKNMEQKYKETIKTAKEKALSLSANRKKVALELEQKVMNELRDLGMAGTIFKVHIEQVEDPDGEIESENKRYALYPHGLDKIEFLLSANKGEELRPLKKVASGGEMSRIMLALKNVILSSDIVDSLVFDEVDAGISGKTAEIVGMKLKHLANDRQVLVITHLPQIAALSDNHFSVQKGKTGERISTVVKHLSQNEKIREVARMLAGTEVTELSIKHAEEMVLKNN